MTSTRDGASSRPTRGPMRWWWGALSAALVVIAAMAGYVAGRQGESSTRASLPDMGPAPSYTLTDQLGQTVESRQFAGKVRIVTFLFPYCTQICPLITAHLVNFMNGSELPAKLSRRVQLVAFNVDPAHAGPKEMKAFLAQYGWDPDDLHWQYLTGDPKEIRRVVTGGYHVSYRRVSRQDESRADAGGPKIVQPEVDNPLAKRAGVDYDIAHNDTLEIVGRKGHIRKIYTHADTVGSDELARIVRALATEPK